MHLSDTSSIAHLRKNFCLKTEFGKILTENALLEEQNKKQKLQILEVLYIRKKQLKT